MAAGHGGARPGSGRKPRSNDTSTLADATANRYDDALTYLEAIVRGDEPADPLRVAAARVVLPYQLPKARGPVESPAPRELARKVRHDAQRDLADDWARKAEAVRAKHRGAA